MTTSLQNLFQALFLHWLQSETAPGDPIEGVTPEFAAWRGTQPDAFSFDSLIHRSQLPGWAWQTVEFSDIFDGQFFFYLPGCWSATQLAQASAAFDDAGTRQQSVTLLLRTSWQPQANAILEHDRVVAFAYYPLLRPHYHQWLFVTTSGGVEVKAYGVFSAGDWLIVVEGAVPDGAHPALDNQLAALVNSNPWYGWIEAARAQQQP